MATIQEIENGSVIQSLKKAWENATTEEQKIQAHEAAEAYRASFGYSGGADGSQYSVIESYNDNVERAKASNNNNTTKLIESASAQVSDLNIDGDKLISYAKYGLVGLIIVAILDRIF